MQPIGALTAVSIAEALVSVVLWVVAYSTRGWLSGYLLLADISAGLFTEETGGQIIDLATSKNPLLTTIVLMSIGGFFDVVATGLLVVAVFNRNKGFSAGFFLCAFFSGVFTIAAVSYYNVEVVIGLFSVGYSWYCGLFSSILVLSSAGALSSAMRRGEISFGDGAMRFS